MQHSSSGPGMSSTSSVIIRPLGPLFVSARGSILAASGPLAVATTPTTAWPNTRRLSTSAQLVVLRRVSFLDLRLGSASRIGFDGFGNRNCGIWRTKGPGVQNSVALSLNPKQALFGLCVMSTVLCCFPGNREAIQIRIV